MNDITLASSEGEAAAVRAIEQHHAELAGALATAVDALLGAVAGSDEGVMASAQGDLVFWARRELVPHALAEEKSIYPVARAHNESRSLIESMVAEHKAILALVAEIETSQPVRAAAAARALKAVFDLHVDEENDLMLPVLAADPNVSVADQLAAMHDELQSGDDEDADHDPETRHGHACGCGETDPPGHPELDVRSVPHAIRHATVFGALDAVRAGRGLILIAPHDPLPLLAQIEQRHPGVFAVDYLERGPEAWRLELVRGTG